jgi:type IV pilus assembly protein PilC
LIFVLPIFEDIYMSMGGEMPRITERLMGFGDFVSRNIIIIFVVLAGVATAIYALAKTGVAKPFTDKLKFRFPLTGGILRARTASDLATNLAMLISSGINTTLAVEMLVPLTENGYIAEKLEKSARELTGGVGPHKAFEGLGLYPELLLKLIAVAGETGKLDTTFERVSMVMGREAERRTENLIALLEPLLIMLLSVLVGFILISVILPVIGIMNSIG